jgi:hypothetical protein
LTVTPTESRTVVLSPRLTVELTIGPGGLTAEWSPRLPDRLTAEELRRYRGARDELVKAFAARTGITIVIAEV